MARLPLSRLAAALGCALVFSVLSALPARAAATLTQRIEPTDVSVGDEVTVTISVLNGGAANVDLPHVDGLELAGTSTATNITFNNGALTSTVSQIFTLVPARAGDFTIPAFDVHASDGQVLHAHEMTIHAVNANGTSSPAGNAAPGAAAGPPPPAPDQSAGPDTGSDADGNIKPPLDSDGRPAKVFMIVTPQTTDAYVGQTIALRIEFFIRMDSLAQQDSLPTIKGSDFLMNDLSLRPQEDELNIGDEAYHRETWLTAISAPKSGDFPLVMERDTYWTKNRPGVFTDPLGNFFGPNPGLAHGNVPSNQFVVHVHPLPDDGRPADFTGAIGQFHVTGQAAPLAVNVGEPVYLDFSIAGQGSFDRVKPPALAPDPAWKTYEPSSKTSYSDESRTQGEKTFRQAIIPQKSGTLPLPAASFSYFDPTAKKYVSLPITLPAITVNGSALADSAATPGADNSASAVPAAPSAADTSDLLPNRLDFGSVQSDFTPPFRQPWFWAAQAAALLLVLLVLPFLLLRSRRRRDDLRAERARRRRSLQELEDAMSDAVQRGDAPAFFLAARQAVQLRWGAPWGLSPEAVTLPVIAARDPGLAGRLAPIFAAADEVMYSGRAVGEIDLPAWERQVREDLEQLQPV